MLPVQNSGVDVFEVDDALHYIYSFKGTPVAVITLTTDYGWRDPDSAGLRGRVYAEMLRTGTVAPVVDLTHSIPSRNLNEAAYILRGAYGDFPAGSVHIVLVDSIHWPNTPLIACSIDGHHFLGLDNGLLAMIRPDVQPSTRVQLDLNNRLDCSTAESLLAAAAAQLPVPCGQKHRWLSVDNAQPEALAAAVSAEVAAWGDVHILVNNTGGPAAGPVLDASPEAFLSAFTNHLLVNQRLAQVLVPSMKTAGYGRIVNVISTSVKAPLHGLGVSNTVRAAVGNWAKTLATELAPSGITVNNVLPGATATERLTAIIDGRATRTGRPYAEIEAEMMAEVPMGRFAAPAEIAAAVAFLASPAASYITGINIPVDGGRTPNL